MGKKVVQCCRTAHHGNGGKKEDKSSVYTMEEGPPRDQEHRGAAPFYLDPRPETIDRPTARTLCQLMRLLRFSMITR